MSINILKDKIGQAYALWRIKPTTDESHAFNRSNRILLTFDDFADDSTIRGFLDVLESQNVKAAFFLVGEWAEKHKNLVKAIEIAGHWVGNHSYSHARLTKLTSNEVEKEIKLGLKCKLLRPPYGAYDDRIRKIAEALNYRIAFWTIDSKDWTGISANEIQERVLNELHLGACVLLHLNAPNTLEALPGLIQGIRNRGFQLSFQHNDIAV